MIKDILLKKLMRAVNIFAPPRPKSPKFIGEKPEVIDLNPPQAHTQIKTLNP